MAEHTKGPWRFFADEDGHHIRMANALTANHTQWESQYLVDYGHNITPEDGDGSQYAEAEANARLIAAAPDLLAACEELLRECANQAAVSVAEYAAETGRGERAAAAIAKARGGTPT